MPATVNRRDFLTSCLLAWGGLATGLGGLIGRLRRTVLAAPPSVGARPEPPRDSVKRRN